MTSSETPNDDPTAPRLTLSITGRNLPTDEADLEALLERLEAAASSILTEVISDAGLEIESWIGQFFPTVVPICPACGNKLDLQSIHLGEEGDAYSLTTCTADCGWSGDGTFRMINLDRRVGEEDCFESAVLAGQATVNYRQKGGRQK